MTGACVETAAVHCAPALAHPLSAGPLWFLAPVALVLIIALLVAVPALVMRGELTT